MGSSAKNRIVQTCHDIDVMANKVYGKFAQHARSQPLQTFWKRMADEEAEHIAFWNYLLAASEKISVAKAFVDPDKTLQELDQIKARAKRLTADCDGRCDTDQAFLIALRMEFYLLHPAFENLFHAYRTLGGEVTPEDVYEEHVSAFLEELGKHDVVSPAVELLGETLRSLWVENRRLARLAQIDPLTGVLNRRGFQVVAGQLAYLAQRTGQSVGVLMIDLDDFKQVNDAFGHEVGDGVLVATSAQLLATVRASDAVGRYGGEEFVVLLSALKPGTSAGIAEKIRATLAAKPVSNVPITVSIGYAEGSPENDIESFLLRAYKAADDAMYAAKAAGKNQIKSEVIPDS